jgi:hypothetical protein
VIEIEKLLTNYSYWLFFVWVGFGGLVKIVRALLSQSSTALSLLNPH